MKQFFYVLFGGLGAVLCGIIFAYGAKAAWQAARTVSLPHFSLPHISLSLPHLSLPRLSFSVPSFSFMAAAVTSQSADGTSISGLKRTIRYTANEEEDLMNAATLSLTSGSVKKVTAGAYLVKNLTDSDVAVTYNADKLLPIASLTKLVTAAVARRAINPEERVTMTRSIMNTYGNTAFFKVGETFRAADLIYPLLMVSSNDAAEALAQDYGRAQFIAKMNEFAQYIGAYRTSFADPSGLSEKNVSTASDIALILEWLRKNDPGVIAATMLKTKTVRTHTWTNPTHFLSWSNYAGGKNGYTDEANRTGAALFTMGKAKDIYAVVILGSSARDADMIKLLGKIKE